MDKKTLARVLNPEYVLATDLSFLFIFPPQLSNTLLSILVFMKLFKKTSIFSSCHDKLSLFCSYSFSQPCLGPHLPYPVKNKNDGTVCHANQVLTLCWVLPSLASRNLHREAGRTYRPTCSLEIVGGGGGCGLSPHSLSQHSHTAGCTGRAGCSPQICLRSKGFFSADYF